MKYTNNAPIIDIKRFAVHDGGGIRTTVFLKGCPLNCVWCHNPEGISRRPQIAYYQTKCIGCGECVSICDEGAHTVADGRHIFNRGSCIGCGRCADVCLGGAITFYGREMTVDELLPLLLEDRDFYENSGGGVTLSGGECLIYPDFCAELLERLKAEGIHTAIDTCGCVSRDNINKVIPYTDIFLYDVKAIDDDVHKKCTGVSNSIILENLRYLDSILKPVEIRIPYVPGYNSNQIGKIGDFLSTLSNVQKIRVLAYHNYAGSKYAALGMNNTLPERLPDDSELQQARETIAECVNATVI
jgi:pyruvate formate lyase activating enzyme